MSVRRSLKVLFLSCMVIGSAANAQSISLLNISFRDLQPEYTLGEPIRLAPVSPPPPSLHVRVFFDSINHLKNYPADSNGCVHYYSWVLWGVGKPSVVTLEALNNQRVLSRGKDGRFAPATVTLVFEAGQQGEPGEFWLKKDGEQLSRYFGHAIQIQIRPSEDQQNLTSAIVATLVESTRIHPAEVAPPAVTCYRVDPHYVTTEATQEENGLEVATVSPLGCRLPEPNASGALTVSRTQSGN